MPIIANWLRPTDVVGSASAGAQLGLALRSANQRAQEAAAQQAQAQAQMEMAQAQHERAAQSAADLLRYRYDALSQARENLLRDDDFRKEDRSAARELKKSEDDALALYRAGVLKNQEERNNKLGIGKPFVQKFHNLQGLPVVETSPGKVELADIPGFTPKGSIPMLKDISLDPKHPMSGGKMSLLLNDPLVNQLPGFSQFSSMGGTNYVPRARSNGPLLNAPTQSAVPTDEDTVDLNPSNSASLIAAPEPAKEVEKKKLSKEEAAVFVKQANGDKQKARQLARDAGYSF